MTTTKARRRAKLDHLLDDTDAWGIEHLTAEGEAVTLAILELVKEVRALRAAVETLTERMGAR